MSEDKHMITAFLNGEDIHKQAASKVLHKPIDEVTKEERSSAKSSKLWNSLWNKRIWTRRTIRCK